MKTVIESRGAHGPIIIWVTALFRGDEVENVTAHLDKMLSGRPFTLATVIIEDWNNQLSPWPVNCDETVFEGNGRETLDWITESLIPALIEQYPDSAGVHTCHRWRKEQELSLGF